MAGKNTVSITIQAKEGSPSFSTLVNKYRNNLQKVRTDAKLLSSAFKTLDVKPMQQLKNESDKLKSALTVLRAAYKRGEISAKDMARAQMQLKMKLQEVKSSAGGVGSAFARIKASYVGLIGISYSLASSFNAYSTFTQKMAEVRTLVNASNADFNNLRKGILDLTSEVPQSANELASAEYDIISAGVKLQDSAKVLKTAAQAAVAGVTNTKTAAQVGISVLNAYGMSIDKLNDVYDVLFTTVKDGVTTFPELSQSIGDVLPTARAAGVDIQTLGASIATMTKAGIKTPRAITALKGAISALSAPSVEAKKAMDSLGISWQGLIPTLRQLKKYSNDPEMLRKLIPDVEARTAVLALTNNFDNLNIALGDMQKAGGATQEAYNKMKNTPENQLKNFKNAVFNLQISLGELISKGVIPAVKKITSLINAYRNATPEVKFLVNALAGGVSVFALWKMGLGSMVFAIKNVLTYIAPFTTQLLGLRTAIVGVQAAAAGGIVISIALAGYSITKLISEMHSLNDILRENKRLSNQYMQSAQQYKYAANIQILSKEQLLKLSEKERAEYKKNLVAAMKYYTNLANANRMAATEAKRLLGIPLPFQSAKAKEAQKNAEKLDAETNKIRKALMQLSHESKPAVANLNKSIESTHPVFMLSVADAKLLGAQLKKAYSDAQRDLKVWKDKVVAYENQIRQEKMSTNELIRNLQRKTMSEEDAWYDEQREAEETLAKAKEAYKKGDYELAKKLVKKAKQLYADLAKEVKTTNEKGQQEVVMSLDETTDVAVEGIKKASNLMTDILKTQKNKAQDMENQYKQKIVNIQKLLKQLTQKGTKDIELDVVNYAEVRDALDKLSMDATKYIHVKYITESGKTIEEKHSDGGIVGKFARGGWLAGYGGGDRIPALLEAGEYVIRKEAVKAYGKSFMDAINRMRIPLSKIPHFSKGGLVANFNYWGNKFPVNLLLDKESAFAQLWEEMRKQGITHYIVKYSNTATPIRTWKHTWFDPWWEKQQIQHKDEIKKVKEIEKVSIDLNFGNKSYPLQGDRSTVDELLAEIEKLKAMGYA